MKPNSLALSQWNWNTLGVNLWKQGNIDKAAHAFAKALRLQPNNVLFLHNDAKLALVQGDISRCQKRIATAMPLVKPDSDSYPLFPFYAWVADPEQGWEPIMRAIEELDSDVELFFISSTFEPVLKRLDKETREIAQQFIEFFQGKIDLKTLKARLAEHEPIPSVPDTGE
jgi:tetratricopeptide (TPR) repeat protein